LAEEAQRYAERVVKKRGDEANVPVADFKLELVMAYMGGALHSANPPQKELA
jgi:hypothetical protein